MTGEVRSFLTAPLTKRIQEVLLVAVILMVAVSNYLIFVETPNDQRLGPVQKILYFHAGSAAACYVAIAILFLGSVSYLVTRDRSWDAVGVAGGEVGFFFSTIVLGSGMIWGRVAWNAWFQFEPRLVTFLLLWLLFLSYVLMRAYGDRQKIASQSAVLGILCSITAPVMWYSIKLLPQVAQMHPQVVARGGLDPEFRLAFFFSMATMVVLACYLMVLRSRLGLLEQRIQEIGSGQNGGH